MARLRISVWFVGYTEVIQDGHRADQYPGSRPVFRNSDRASTPGYRDPGAFLSTPTDELITSDCPSSKQSKSILSRARWSPDAEPFHHILVQRILRHAKAHVTRDCYIKVFDSTVSSAMHRLQVQFEQLEESKQESRQLEFEFAECIDQRIAITKSQARGGFSDLLGG